RGSRCPGTSGARRGARSRCVLRAQSGSPRHTGRRYPPPAQNDPAPRPHANRWAACGESAGSSALGAWEALLGWISRIWGSRYASLPAPPPPNRQFVSLTAQPRTPVLDRLDDHVTVPGEAETDVLAAVDWVEVDARSGGNPRLVEQSPCPGDGVRRV